MKYIYQNSDWHDFTWNEEKILNLLSKVKIAQALLLNKMSSSDFLVKRASCVDVLTVEIIKANERVGQILEPEQVRSSVSNRLGVDLGGSMSPERDIEGVIEVTLDAAQNFDKKMTKERLFDWHSKLFPTGFSRMNKIHVGQYRHDEHAQMRITSGLGDNKIIHYEAPKAEFLEKEMKDLIDYINQDGDIDYLIKAAIVHLWFVVLHPFDDGNGRISRALTDMMLAKSDNLKYRFYTMSSQIGKNIKDYHKIMEQAQKGTMDITNWLEWFLENLLIAIETCEERQNKMLNII